jgi:hypothetical protein
LTATHPRKQRQQRIIVKLHAAALSHLPEILDFDLQATY